MTEDQIPVAVWSGTFRVIGVDLRCHVLADGRRIVNADDVARMFAAADGEATEAEVAQLEAFLRWRCGG